MMDINFNELVKINRIRKGFTQDELALMTNMSKKKLSAIECGRLTLQEDDKTLLLEALDIDVQLLNDVLVNLDKSIWKAFHTIVYSEPGLPNIDAEITKILNTTPIALNLTAVNLYLFTKAVLMNNKKEIELYRKQIENYIDTLSNNHKATFYDFYATFLFNSGLYEEAIVYLDKALYYVTDNGLKGYIFYHYGYVYSEMYQCLQAYEYYQKALVIFNETNNYVKVVYTYITLADIYNRMKQRKEAIQYLLKARIISNKLTDINDSIKNTILVNLSWLYLFTQDYDNSILYAKEALPNEKKDKLYFCLAYVYYKKQDFYQSLNYIEIGTSELSANNLLYKILLLLKKIIKDYAGSRELLCKTYDEANYNDREIKLLLLDMIMEYSNYFDDNELKIKYCTEYRNILMIDDTL